MYCVQVCLRSDTACIDSCKSTFPSGPEYDAYCGPSGCIETNRPAECASLMYYGP